MSATNETQAFSKSNLDAVVKNALSDKYVKQMVFGYWIHTKSIGNKLNVLEIIQLYENVETQKNFYDEFNDNYKTIKTEMMNEIKSKNPDGTIKVVKSRPSKSKKNSVAEAGTDDKIVNKVEKMPKGGKVEKKEKPEKGAKEKSEKAEKVEKEKSEKAEKVEKEKPEKVEKVEKEKPEKVEKVEKEKPEKVEKVEKEKVEKEKAEKVEKAEKADTLVDKTKSPKSSKGKKSTKNVVEKMTEEEISMQEISINGTAYIMDKSNTLYDVGGEHEEIGNYDSEKKEITLK